MSYFPWDAVHRSLVVFCPCPECAGKGFVERSLEDREGWVEHFTEICGECHGSGTEGALMASEPVPEEESQSQY